MNTYELAGHGCTTGWDARTNDVNGENLYKMRPIEVAAQAANVTEFRAIMLDPAFEPDGARVRYFAEVGRLSSDMDAQARYARLRPELKLYEERFTEVA
jgi:hypothetical protein